MKKPPPAWWANLDFALHFADKAANRLFHPSGDEPESEVNQFNVNNYEH
ncbi:MAG: hypothetical protein SFV22_04075 [Saprospiraceae bacterium]|nr:hypothetical protein [Saprospiraceae bacterium]